MDVSHPSLFVHHPPSRHTQTQPQPQIPSRTHAQILTVQHENPPPPKRRRANSGNPSDFSIVAHTTLPPSTDWHQSRHSYPSTLIENNLESSVARDISPDQISRVSAVATIPLSGPQLRKKPKSSSIKNTTTLRAESPHHPSSHSSTQASNDTVQYIGTPNGYPVSSIYRANSGSSQHLSPNQKRPPASHSSYGVETTCGPPPSYSTQRTLSQERIRKLDRNSQTRGQVSSSDPAQIATPEEIPDASAHKKEITTFVIHSSPETADSQSVSTPTDGEGPSGVKIQGEPRISMDEDTKMSSSDERKSEDLFLNIARVDATRHSQPKTEKRRSRMSIPFLPSSRSSQSVRSSIVQPQAEIDPTPSARVEVSRSHSKRASFGGQTSNTYYARNPVLEGSRFREHSVESASTSERNESGGHESGLRRLSIANTEPMKLTHHSSAGLRQNGLVSESVNLDQMKSRENIATESTISTTAPSTVWDELDDLKSRIRKLELTGKLPPSSAAAMSSAERPRTATTAATTMSTSPKYKPSEVNVQPTGESVSSPNIHPLLHEALNNARAIISQDVYQRLQATAQDALQLAALVHHEDVNSRGYAAPLSNDRQLKRRAESMCRSLTELAIALAGEAKPTQHQNRPSSREQSLPPNSMLRGRRYSNDPADRSHVAGRVQSRIESRRTSVHLRQGGSGYVSPENASYQSPTSNSQLSDPRVHRSSTLLRKRGQGSFDGTVDSFETSPSIRPGSRAVTDIGTYRRPTIDPMQSSREYTSQHPLPHQQDNYTDSGYGVTFASRRKHASPASVVGVQGGNPATPREAWGRVAMTPADTQSPDVVSEVGGSGRLGFSRRSIGFTSRVGSNVGSRLRAVRAERNSRESMDARGNADIPPLSYDNHSTSVVDLGLRHPSND